MNLDFCHSCAKGSQTEEGERGEMKRHIATSVKCRSVSEGSITHLPIEEKEVTWTEYLKLLLWKKFLRFDFDKILHQNHSRKCGQFFVFPYI